LLEQYEHHDLLAVVLSRAARSARLARHFDLDFPTKPATEPYYCRKHRRECRPTGEAIKFLRAYSADTAWRLRAFADVRRPATTAVIIHGDARSVDIGVDDVDGVVTSPPYFGGIDYHEQHRYAYELLGLADRSAEELGSATKGRSKAALAEYVDGMTAVFANIRPFLRAGAAVVVVVDDGDLFEHILGEAGLELEQRTQRRVGRRTGLRTGDFYEQILVVRA
jgi:hypothetical protein